MLDIFVRINKTISVRKYRLDDCKMKNNRSWREGQHSIMIVEHKRYKKQRKYLVSDIVIVIDIGMIR